jgi:hypothetical protein
MHGRASHARVAFGLGRSRADGGAARALAEVESLPLLQRRPGPAAAGGGQALQGEEAAAGSGACVRLVCHLSPSPSEEQPGRGGDRLPPQQVASKVEGALRVGPVRFVYKTGVAQLIY